MMKKAITGQDYLFEWYAPKPITGTPEASFVVSPVVSGAMTQGRADITVSAMGNDRRTLTINNQVTGLKSDQTPAYLITDGDSIYNVTVIRIEGTTAILSDPLSREIDLSSAATLQFCLWYTTAPALTVTAASAQVPYTVSYVEDLGTSTVNRLQKGLLKVTPRPFNTGLNHDALCAQFPQLADMVPRRQSSFNPQVRAAQDELELMLRDVLTERGRDEDDIFNADSFLQAHAFLSCSIIYESVSKYDESERMRERAINLFNLTLRTVDLDLNSDGVLDEGEENIRESGSKRADFRASFTGRTPTAYETTFEIKRGMRF